MTTHESGARQSERERLERYRLYIDESGDHVFRQTEDPGHRYLCLLGCFMREDIYLAFHRELSEFKQRHIPHSPDEPVILHREDIVNRRKCFWLLRDATVRRAFDDDLLALLARTDFRVVAVVIDKRMHHDRYQEAASHPYHLGLGFLLQRYCGYLNHINRQGDVMAESRGGGEDRLLKTSYELVYKRGAWMFKGEQVRQALTSKQLKVKPKSANIAGLQLADLLAQPVRSAILCEKGIVPDAPSPFAQRLMAVVEDKFNRHLYDGRTWGYGKVFFPE